MFENKVVHVNDGEWYIIEWEGQREECCGCGLVHEVDYRVKDGRLQFRATQKPKVKSRRRKR